MPRERRDTWRARAADEDEKEWRGRWRTENGAWDQAVRWAEQMPLVWVESRDGQGVNVVQNAGGMGDPEPYNWQTDK